ncbi:MAG TPA: hypothetical protein VHZ77_04685 [Gaiellaceae bacterium]|nr:hypothetical protein [Gaiellaceae bacterium]
MRSGVALVAITIGLVAASGATGHTTGLPHSALTPDAVAFRDRLHGILGGGWQGCEFSNGHCHPQGTISVTSDGGKTWTVVRRTSRPVVATAYWRRGDYYVQLDDGETLLGHGSSWRRSTPAWSRYASACPQGSYNGITANPHSSWAICSGQPGAGNQSKSVYRQTTRGWKRVAYTGMTSANGHGGISSYGYPVGIAGNERPLGFGIIWESRGTLYVSHDGGHDWQALPKVSRPEEDFGQWAYVLPRSGDGFVVLAIGGSEKRRLLETTDGGRTWRVVHRWGY